MKEQTYISVNRLLLYRDFERQQLLDRLCSIVNGYERAAEHPVEREKMIGELYACAHELLELAAGHGFEGNLWHHFLTYLLANHENAFSMACEIVGEIQGSLNQAADHDFEIFMQLYRVDFDLVEQSLGVRCFAEIGDFENVDSDRKLFNRRIRDRIGDLTVKLANAGTVQEFHRHLVSFYKDFGVGKFGLHKAFSVRNINGDVHIVPITNVSHIHFDDLVGYELQKKKLRENTDAFVQGKKANNCLLFGDAGTGKSSSVKALLNEYYDRGLRMIEVYKHQFQDLPRIIAQLKNRNYYFIIYMDDLSFEEFEVEYKYLKAVIEGSLEKKPDNVLIYATSNRGHLVREKFSDKEGRRDDLHASDTVQEKLSLVSRFGVTIFFVAPDKKEFQNIVDILAQRSQLPIDRETLLEEANKWELSHGGLSGRTAQQFINYLLGQQ